MNRKPRTGTYRSALRSRDLRLIVASQAVSGIGTWAYGVALVAVLLERTHSSSWVAASLIARFLPALLFSTYAGVLAERFERIKLMNIVNIGCFVIQVALAIAAWKHAAPLVLVALAVSSATMGTPYTPAVSATIPEVVAETDLAAANALNGTVDNLIIIAGPALGAVLVVLGGAPVAFLLNAASFLIAAVLVSSVGVRSQPSDVAPGGQGPLGQMAAGLRAATSTPTTRTLLAYAALTSFVYGTDTVLFAPISTRQLHTGASGYGYLLAGLGVGGLLGATVVNRLAARPRLAPVIFGGIAVYTVPSAVLVVTHEPAVGFAVEVVRGVGTLVVDTLAITAFQRSVAPEMMARAFGVFWTVVLAAIIIGVGLTPLVLHAGLHTEILVFALGVPALCLLGLPRMVAFDRVGAAAAAQIASRVALLERLDLFAAASRPGLELLARSAVDTTVASGAAVVTEGDPADAFYAVVDGELEVTASGDRGGPPERLRTLGPGSYFGEIGLLAHIPRTATVTARSECRVLEVSGSDFLDALSNLTASPALLAGARSRLALSHPSRASVLDEAGASMRPPEEASAEPSRTEPREDVP
jgi:predicted MFS family arabinose efflux permease